MSASLKNLTFKANSSTTLNIRMFEIDGAPWFVATDACRALGLDISAGSTMHLRKLDSDERQPIPPNLVEGSGRGMAQATLISEAGLYKLITKSDKPAAKAFDRWVRHDVLPAIRKTGGYLLNEEARDTAKADDRAGMPLPEDFAQLLMKLTTVVEQQSQLLSKLLEEREEAKQPAKVVKRDTRMITASIAKERYDLPGTTAEIGWAATIYCTERGINYRKRRKATGTNAYPSFVFSEIYAPV